MGELVLIHHTEVKKELSCKVKPRYLGPYKVVRRTKGGSYVLEEMDGTVQRSGVAAFRLIPYINRLDELNFNDDTSELLSDDETSFDSE